MNVSRERGRVMEDAAVREREKMDKEKGVSGDRTGEWMGQLGARETLTYHLYILLGVGSSGCAIKMLDVDAFGIGLYPLEQIRICFGELWEKLPDTVKDC